MTRTRFIVVGAPRTGTSLTIETLDAHPRIRCYGGIFNRGAGRSLDPDGPEIEATLEHVFASKRRLHAPADATPEDGQGPIAVGFKVHYEQWAGTRARAYLHGLTDLRLVHVVRENVLRTLVSAKAAAASGRYHSRDAAGPPPEPVHIDVSELEAATERDAEARARLERDFGSHARFTATYAAWQRDRAALIEELQAFLDVEPRDDLRTDLVKTGTAPLSAAISNHDELRARVEGTALARFFDPDCV